MDGVRVTVPRAVGVIVKVCDVEELLKVKTIGVDKPPPDGVTVIVPVYAADGVIVKFAEAILTSPDVGPVKV